MADDIAEFALETMVSELNGRTRRVIDGPSTNSTSESQEHSLQVEPDTKLVKEEKNKESKPEEKKKRKKDKEQEEAKITERLEKEKNSEPVPDYVIRLSEKKQADNFETMSSSDDDESTGLKPLATETRLLLGLGRGCPRGRRVGLQGLFVGMITA